MFTFKKDARICLFVRIGRVKVERERVGRVIVRRMVKKQVQSTEMAKGKKAESK